MQKYEMCDVRDTHALTVDAKVQERRSYTVIQGIPEYKVTEVSRMLPLQNLDEEWENGRMF